MEAPDDVGIRVAVIGGIEQPGAGGPGAESVRPRGRAVGIAAAAARLGARVDLVLLGDPDARSPWDAPPGTAAPGTESMELALPVTGEPVRVTVVRHGYDPPTADTLRGQLESADEVIAAPGGGEAQFAIAVLRAGRAAGALTVLQPDLTCAQVVPAFGYADVIVVNLRDAADPPRDRRAVEQLAGALLAYGPEMVAAAAGGWGTLFAWTDGHVWWPAPAAADRAAPGRVAEALTAGLAVALAEGQACPDATRFAAAGSALATRLPGTTEPYPSRRQVRRLLAQPWQGETVAMPEPVPSPAAPR